MSARVHSVAAFVGGAAVAALLLGGSAAARDSVGETPSRILAGAATGLALPTGIDIDPVGNSVVANFGLDSITVHPPGASDAAAPLRTIAGGATGISLPTQVDVDAAGVTYVASASPASIRVFAAGAAGNVHPVRAISGAATRMDLPYGVAAGPDGTVYVANTQGASVTVYAPGASGNVAPIRTIAGPLTRLTQPTMLELVGGDLFVGDRAGAVSVFRAAANGNVTPVRRISGPKTGLGEVYGVGVDSSGNVYAVDYDSDQVLVFEPDTNGNVKPLRTLVGAATRLGSPMGLALDDRRTLRVASFETSSVLTFDALVPPAGPETGPQPGVVVKPGQVLRLKVTGKATAARRTVKWRPPATDGGARLTGYRVVVKKGKTVLRTTSVKAVKTTVKLRRATLPTGTLKVVVRATSSAGTGPGAKVRFTVR